MRRSAAFRRRYRMADAASVSGCHSSGADPVAVQFLQAGYHVFTLIYSTDHAPLLWQVYILQIS